MKSNETGVFVFGAEIVEVCIRNRYVYLFFCSSFGMIVVVRLSRLWEVVLWVLISLRIYRGDVRGFEVEVIGYSSFL